MALRHNPPIIRRPWLNVNLTMNVTQRDAPKTLVGGDYVGAGRRAAYSAPVPVIPAVISRLERAYDAFPRNGGAIHEEIGPFTLFIQGGGDWPYYGRPTLGSTAVTRDDVAAVRQRQRDLGAPESLEWVHEVTPTLADAAAADALVVHRHPLMVLDPARLPDPASLTEAAIDLLDPDNPNFPDWYAQQRAVAQTSFTIGGTAVGVAGIADRDAARNDPEPDQLTRARALVRAGHLSHVVAHTDEGVLATATAQSALGASEIVGVATLPAARRRGLGAAVSAAVARHRMDRGDDLIFLSAASDDVARVYASIGFHRVGTACIAEPAQSPE